ncbi:hypothetical protein ABEB36_002201 [Hypothenemus hampei]|uniref:Peptidase M12B domain-containing protein n=1 Tax=Hypothenemus hampei TaxID=57062 RepID=A0ABD1F8J4_HYPHA
MLVSLLAPFLLRYVSAGFIDEISIIPEKLHDFMSESELLYYFQTGNKSEVPDYEIVYFPLVPPNGEINFQFSDFNRRTIDLTLNRNTDLITSAFKTYIHQQNKVQLLNETPLDCHYLHQSLNVTAALSFCTPKAVQGLIFIENSTYEVQPLTHNLQRLTKRHANFEQDATPHIVKKGRFGKDFIFDEVFPFEGNIFSDGDELFDEVTQYKIHHQHEVLTVELALFFDEAAYKIFAPYFDHDERKLQNMLLAYINGVQALYHHPSLGTTLDLVLVRMDIMKSQPKDMPHYHGERNQLLDSFCQYQASINPKDDNNPDHWDMALYVSGLDFYSYENGRKSGVTMGLATVGGVCLDQYACVIAEFGTTNIFGKPYPSSGFTSVYILAHEIGHNLGMHHDSSGNGCPKEGFIMSPSRGTNGETEWSSCSAKVMANLDWAKCLKDSTKPLRDKDHSRYLGIPGRIYTAKRQCEILLRDKDAIMSPSQPHADICHSLQCKTPNRIGFYFAGPALDGTPCGNGMYCYGGHCSSKPPPKPIKPTFGGWSEWKKGTCTSGCIQKSLGMQISTRECNNPIPMNTNQDCKGVHRQYNLCRDINVCKGKILKTADEYASRKCKDFSKLLPELDPVGIGLQAPHEDERIWASCAIYCKRKDSGVFYTPRVELNDLGVTPYFPDGTWCYKDSSNLNYYCTNHHCLPENFKITKNQLTSLDDIPFSQNAKPNHKSPMPSNFKNYFALTPNGKPIQTTFKNSDIHEGEDEWETKDYVEMPSIEKRFKVLLKELDDFDYI